MNVQQIAEQLQRLSRGQAHALAEALVAWQQALEVRYTPLVEEDFALEEAIERLVRLAEEPR